VTQITVVTGKGGVGKTTIAVLLALRAARHGRRAIVVETGGARVVPGWFGRASRGYDPVELLPRVSTLSVTPELAIEDFVVSRIKVRRLYRLVFQNRVMAPLIEGVPGLAELVQLGKAYALAEERTPDGAFVWDRVIVDAPATGHGLTMLASPRLMMDVTGSGPFHDNAKLVHDAIADPLRTGIVLVSLPEEMPVTEAKELWARLGPAREQVRATVLNGLLPEPFDDTIDWSAARSALGKLHDPAVDEAVAMTNEWVQRAAIQERLRRELAEAIPVPRLGVPWSFARQLDRGVLEEMGAALDPLVLA
jgi:anion-transporting  ArsA/GET3 family ATPase